ncbi:hypothetical protein BOTNAR_0446g00080 [Botryotinia narcissicola]|uniref:Uncharacterized protein n=1 Tax=Botryotinia narcissicola TaxID=278944 RepID=A0A4Z1HQP9_9HELO|nr:hypothetical protein BOTNAR_0446g00080 [Botryotinia narcissicola]
MPKTKAALKSAQSVQQKQKQKLKTEQKSKMMAIPVGRNAKSKASLDNTESNSDSNVKTTRNSESNGFTSSESMSNSTPTPKPVYPKQKIIWHKRANKKSRSTTASLKKDAESAPNHIPTPTIKKKTQSAPVGEKAKPSSGLESQKLALKPTYPKQVVIWHHRLQRKRSSKTTSLKNKVESTTNPISSLTPTPTPTLKTKTESTPARITTQPSPETLEPTLKPKYPKPVVIWHQNPHRKRISKTTKSKKDAESTTKLVSSPKQQTNSNTTPVRRTTKPSPETPEPAQKPTYPKTILKQGVNTSSVRGTVQPKPSTENIKPTPKAKSTRNLKPNGPRSAEIATSKKNTPVAAKRVFIEISDSDSDSDDEFDSDFDADEVRDSDPDSDSDAEDDVDVDEDEDVDVDIDEDSDVDVDEGSDNDGDEAGDVDFDEDVDIDENSDEDIDVDANTSPQSTSMYSSDMNSISDINSAPASPIFGDLDLMPWIPEVDAVPASGMENLFVGNGDVDADANANGTSYSIQMYSPTLDTTSNIMGSTPDFTADLTFPYRGDLMLSVPEAELEPASELGNQLPGDGALLSEEMYMDIAMDVDVDRDLHLGVDANMDMDMGMDGHMNADVSVEANLSPSQTSWKGMCMDPPLTAEEKDWDFSNVGIEEIDGFFEEMEKEMGGDVDVEMGE